MMTKLMRLVVLVVALVAIAGVGGLPRQDVRAVYDEEVMEDPTGDTSGAATGGTTTTTNGAEDNKPPRAPKPTGDVCVDLRGSVVYFRQMSEWFYARGVMETSDAFATASRNTYFNFIDAGCRW